MSSELSRTGSRPSAATVHSLARGRWRLGAEVAVDQAPRLSYWDSTRRPLPSLFLVSPLMVVYEAGAVRMEGAGGSVVRTGADAWMRESLASIGLTDPWTLPVLLVIILLGWQAAGPRDWRFGPSILAGMVIESLILAVSLIGISRLLDLGFAFLERHGPPVLLNLEPAVDFELTRLFGYVGAGIYEEALFRLILVPLLFGLLRLLQAPQILASALAVTGSALLFSLAHHAGTPGEIFTWYAFIFRWLAGVFFAWVFVIRGFGIAVGTHTFYDILVGWVGWHL
jgi:hypothetical protein